MDKPRQNILCLPEICPALQSCTAPGFIPFDEHTQSPSLLKC